MADHAVSELVGNLLLVAITILMAVGLSAVILAQPPPIDTTRPDLLFAVNKGPDDAWNTGDENVSIAHKGGEALTKEITTIRVTGGTPDRTYAGSTLGGVFDDAAAFRVGTTWYSTSQTMTIASGNAVGIVVVATRAGGSVALASTSIFAGG